MIYPFKCIICGAEFEVVQEMNAEHKAFHCGIEAHRIWGVNTDKDLAYNFTTDMFDGKPVQIFSKRQFKGLLKKYNLADASIKECRQEADFRKKLNNEDYLKQRRKTAENIYHKMKERGQLIKCNR